MMPCSVRSLYPSKEAIIQGFPSKNRGDALDYSLYLSPFCCEPGEMVIRLTVDVPQETGLKLLWSALSNALATIGLQGGTPGTQSIIMTLETSTGRRYVRPLRIIVLDDAGSVDTVQASLSPPSGASLQPNLLTSNNNYILTLADGRFLTA
ncbi:phage fiber-tail adaptor protein [Bombella saccharophila]|uniref:Uncharacterized protein n=1 Tax=Bombella saccharophila TaxID=2967338 RepID=A0ABT3W987_9PROT|nr:hypothetical protein [Bombella saccharophila]MCX5615353.1 hypothetical protein [Bombella saccharophila]